MSRLGCLKPQMPDSLSTQLSVSKNGDVAGSSDKATEVCRHLVLRQSRGRG